MYYNIMLFSLFFKDLHSLKDTQINNVSQSKSINVNINFAKHICDIVLSLFLHPFTTNQLKVQSLIVSLNTKLSQRVLFLPNTTPLVTDFLVHFAIHLWEGFLTVKLFPHAIVQGVIKHFTEIFFRKICISIQHLEPA